MFKPRPASISKTIRGSCAVRINNILVVWKCKIYGPIIAKDTNAL